jgi:hypothetical protein
VGNGYARSTIAHLSAFVTDDIDQVLERSETIVIGNRDRASTRIVQKATSEDLKVVDLVRVDGMERLNGNYQGICW